MFLRLNHRSRRFLKGMLSALAASLLTLAAFLYGYMVRDQKLPLYSITTRFYQHARYNPAIRYIYLQFHNFSKRAKGETPGLWRVKAPEGATGPPTVRQQEQVAQLMALGYVGGVNPVRGPSGVTIHNKELAYNGLNFVISGHAPEAFLTDMDGKILHRWSYGFRRAFPKTDVPMGFEGVGFWRRAHLFDNGDLLAIFEGNGLIKIDVNSNLLWTFSGRVHHDLDVTEDGQIYVLTREIKFIPRINKEMPTLEDFVTVLDSDGRRVRKLSLLKAFENSVYASFLGNAPEWGDIFHTNTLEILDGSQAHRSPIFKQGNVLIAARYLNVTAIVDLELEQVVWALSGMWMEQHQPTLLNNGNILLFDNQGHRGVSKVIEFDPLSQKVVWTYEGDESNGFYSRTCGSNQRLPNGNTLITESDDGRAFEVTPDKRIVWEYSSPYRMGEHDELVAVLLEVIRLDREAHVNWLGGVM